MPNRIGWVLAALFLATQSQAAVGVRLIMGLTDDSEVDWSGSITVSGGKITKLEPWRADGKDAISGANAWKIATHKIRLFSSQNTGFVANGVIAWLSDETGNTNINVNTAQGSFTLRLADIPYGRALKVLNGRVMADRIPASFQITNTPDEQDYPAIAADKNGNLWLAYLEFRHNKDHDRIRANVTQPLKNFEDLQAPTGGDHIVVRKFSGNAWGPPILITSPGGDVYRPAVSVDGSGRPWVFWAKNRKGNFDIWGRVLENGKPNTTVRLSDEPGSDIEPVAATDSKGRVWVAWQGWRDGKASIFAVTQDANRFSAAAVVASSAANEWNPAIAADKEGRVSLAWDSYRNGNYDVLLRTATAPGVWGKEAPVADSPRYEAYPSLAYDREGRLWVAYEEGSERWGKDWGAYDTSGVSLYQARAVRLVAFDRAGKLITTKTDLDGVLPGVPNEKVDIPGTQGEETGWLKPNPSLMRERKPSATPQMPRGPKNSLPRLTADPSGRLWLAFRSAFPVRWAMIGTVWTEHVVSYDGKSWTGPIYLAHSDNLLDNRPAVISTRPGELVVVGSSDGRGAYYLVEQSGYGSPANETAAPDSRSRDPYNNDLYAAVISLSPASGPTAVKPAAPAARALKDPMDAIERPAIKRMRDYRFKNDGAELRIVRGEFHRHSEVSMDGGGDGTLLDQWRYMLDTAGMDWVGCCDHDNGGGREYTWWITQKQTDMFYTPGRFSAMFHYERSVRYPEGHRNVIFVQRGIRPLPRLPKMEEDSTGHAPDTQMFYAYLKRFDGIVASHTSGTGMGTDWRDNDPNLEPAVEIYQGDRQNYEMPGAPRSNSENDSIGRWRPKGFINLALAMGYKLGFEASSDHFSTHISYCNLYVTDNTREAVLQAFKKRHIFGATDNILADVRSGPYMMGDAFTTSAPPELKVKLAGTGPFAKVLVIKDNKYVYSTEPKKAEVEFTWRDTAAEVGKTSYYYVRGEQENGELVWASPMWITYK